MEIIKIQAGEYKRQCDETFCSYLRAILVECSVLNLNIYALPCPSMVAQQVAVLVIHTDREFALQSLDTTTWSDMPP